MNYLRSYKQFESDSWAGSLYAYDNSTPGKHQSDIPTEDLFTVNSYLFKCDDCHVEFYSINKGICKNCKSENCTRVNFE